MIYLTDEQHSLALSAVTALTELREQYTHLQSCGTDCQSQVRRISDALASLQTTLLHFSSPEQRSRSGPGAPVPAAATA